MKGASFPAMDDDPRMREALAAAGYTGLRGAIVFTLVLGVIGAMLGSVVFAILLNMLVPTTPPAEATLIGALTGGALGVVIGAFKIHRGNMEAREEVEDQAWRRQMKREFGK